MDEMLAFAEQAGREYEAELSGKTPEPSPDDRETGETVPNTETLKLLSGLFDVSINTLLGSPRQLICQCCGMPLEDINISRETDGTFNEEYCKWCYADGKFVYTSLEELLNFLESHMSNGALAPGASQSLL